MIRATVVAACGAGLPGSEAEGLHYFQVNLRQIAEIAGNLVERIIRHRASKIAGSEF
jgi:hypothetical protein